MLSGVDLIAWEQLGFPQIPELLARLQSHDEKVRNRAYSDLEWDVIYSGESFQNIELGWGSKRVFATEIHLFVVPLLITLLHKTEPEIQDVSLQLLAETASFSHLLTDAEGIFSGTCKSRSSDHLGRVCSLS